MKDLRKYTVSVPAHTIDYFDTTQLLAYDEVGHYLYYLSDACNFIRISLDKVSNNVKDFVKNITTISPKPIKIFSSILEYDTDTVLDSNVLNNLFEGKISCPNQRLRYQNYRLQVQQP